MGSGIILTDSSKFFFYDLSNWTEHLNYFSTSDANYLPVQKQINAKQNQTKVSLRVFFFQHLLSLPDRQRPVAAVYLDVPGVNTKKRLNLN